MFRRVVMTSLGAIALASAAQATDLSSSPSGGYKDSYYTVNWQSFYVGAHIGGFGSTFTLTEGAAPYNIGTPGHSWDNNVSGVFGGGTLGWNIFQRGPLVFGLEGDLGDLSMTNTAKEGVYSGTTVSSKIATGAYGDFTGRVGYAFDRALVYGKGGLAFSFGDGSYVAKGTKATTVDQSAFDGYTYGGGLE